MTTTASHTYRFGEFRLDPAARELWRGDELLELPRLTFDGLAFLVGNRDRAVSRDELIDAVWGKPYVEDILVTQLIMRVRRAIGDDSHEPRFIRTVTGFGYRWIADTEELPAPGVNGSAGDAASPLADPHPTGSARTARPWFLRWRVLAVAALAAAGLVVVLIRLVGAPDPDAAPLPREAGTAVAVLPIDVRAGEGADAGWVRLGAMDLIAERLRDSGLPVPPSDSVIAALHAAEERTAAARSTAVRRALGAGVLVRGEAIQGSDSWTIELTATAADGMRRRIETAAAEILPAARQAADLLLAALGRTVPAPSEGDEALTELVQRVKAAVWALELDTARTVLARAPEPLREEPELRYWSAIVEFRAGRYGEAREILAGLLEAAAVAAPPRLHAKALLLRGMVAVNERADWFVGEPHFDAAVGALDDRPWSPELATALALRAGARIPRRDFDAVVRDLGRSRALFEALGDRRGLIVVHNYFGNLELERRRPADALPHFRAALRISQSFGEVEGQRANLSGVLIAQGQLLRWTEALATSERLRALRDRVEEPLRRSSIDARRAAVLLALGRQREAQALLTAGTDEGELPPYAVYEREHVRAQAAWQQGRPRRALDAAERAIARWPAGGTIVPPEPTEILLLHQRASITVGRPTAASRTLSEVSAPAGSWETGHGGKVAEARDGTTHEDEPAYLVARAEWAARRGDHEAAERLFREAAAEAERGAVPATLVLVHDAYARWLLARGRTSEALALAGRVAGWADRDYDSALLQVAVLHAAGRHEAWAAARRRARDLAGEREIPENLRLPPG